MSLKNKHIKLQLQLKWRTNTPFCRIYRPYFIHKPYFIPFIRNINFPTFVENLVNLKSIHIIKIRLTDKV